MRAGVPWCTAEWDMPRDSAPGWPYCCGRPSYRYSLCFEHWRDIIVLMRDNLRCQLREEGKLRELFDLR